MPSLLDIDKDRTEIFFALHHELIRHCAVRWDNGSVWRTTKGKRLLDVARPYFGYSTTTANVDIMRVLIKRFDPKASLYL
jgi:hypothetical protein